MNPPVLPTSTATTSRLPFGSAITALLLTFTSASWAANFTVSNTNDTGAGSLRQAMADAVAAGTGPHVINASGVTGTVSLQSALPTITNTNITIHGPTSGTLTVTRGAAANFRIFYVTNASGAASLTVNRLTMTNGVGTVDMEAVGVGGGIAVKDSTLVLNYCTVSGCTSASNGGGIHLGGTVGSNGTLNFCTISGNTTTGGAGGGISATDGTGSASHVLNLNNCTISGNSTGSAAGGGVTLVRATGNFRNCTISGNTSASTGGGVNTGSSAATLNAINCTITNNTCTTAGGGIRGSGTGGSVANLINTLVVGNKMGPSTPDDTNWGTGTRTAKNSVIGVHIGTAYNTVTASQIGSAASPKVVNLGSLANNGGVTQTHQLLSSTPELAIDLGSNADASQLATDQRGVGYNRFNGTVDIGAYETGVTAPAFTGVQPLGAPAQISNNTTLAFTVPPGADRLLVVAASGSHLTATTDISGVTFNGTPMTQAVKKQDGVAVDGIYCLTLGTGTTAVSGNIVVTLSAGSITSVGAIALQNVSQSTPIGDTKTASNPSVANASSSLSVTSATGDLVIDLFDICESGGVGTQTPGSGQAVVHNVDAPSGSLFGYYQTSIKPGAASVPMSWTSNGQAMIHVAANIKQAVSATAPTVTTATQSSVTHNSATLGGNVTADGGASVTERGIVWGTSSNPTTANNKVSNGSGTGSFSATVTGLPSSTTVHVRAYAINSVGTAYGSNISFATSATPAPEIAVTGNSNAISDGDTGTSATNHTDFGSQAAISGSVTRTFTIQNTGTADLTLGSVTVAGTHAADFTVTTQPTSPVAASGSTTFQVKFDPSAIGSRTASLSFATNDSDENPFNFAISGAGIGSPTISSPTFTNVTGTSATLGGTVDSDNGAAVTSRGVVYALTSVNSNPTVGGTGSTFALASTAGTGTFTVNVTGLTPGAQYSYRAWATNSVGRVYTTESSTITTSGAPEITLSGNSSAINDGDTGTSATNHTDFGSVFSDSGSVTRTFTIQNTGTTDLTLGSVSVSGTHAADFTITTQPTSPVAASGSTTFQVKFDPSAIGSRTASLSFATNDSDENPFNFAISGAGIAAPTISSPTSTSVTGTSATLGGTVDSDNGAAITSRGVVYALTSVNSNPTVGGTGSTFALASTAGTGTFTVNITGLTPGAQYSYRAWATNSIGRVYTTESSTITTSGAPEIALSGNGSAINDGDTGTSITNHTDFGSAAVAGGTIVRTFTVSNTGTANLNLSGTPKVVISGTNAADFSVTAQPSTPVSAAGGSAAFQITFSPNASGLRTAAVSIASDDADENPFEFSIAGTGSLTDTPGLADLVLSAGSLNPAFASATSSYSTAVDNAISALSLTPTATQSTATIKVNGGPAVSGAASGPFSLKVGANTFTINVTNASGTETTTYTVTVVREAVASGEIEVEQPSGTPLATGSSTIGFGNTAVGESANKTFIIKNQTNSALTISGISLVGGDTADFSVDTSGMASSLSSSGSQTSFSVIFAPTALGARATTLRIQNSDTDEGTFDIALNGTGANGGTGIFSFGSEQYNIFEEAGPAMVEVKRNGGTTGPASVRLSTVNGTAKTPGDFAALNDFVVNFADGEGSQMVPINIIADALNTELNEFLTVQLSSPSAGASLGSIISATVQIVEPDAVIPTVTIVSPMSGSKIPQGPVTMSGGAKDNKGVAKVEISVNGGPWTEVTLIVPNTGTTNGLINNYEAAITPVPGSNTLSARSYDFRGNISTVVTRTFDYVVLRPLTLTLTPPAGGNVTITPALVGGNAELGVTYTFKATANSGYFWSGWTAPGVSSPASEATTLSLTMTEGLTVEAAFIQNFFTAGAYNGLATAANGTSPSGGNFGYFNGTLTSTGSFTGKVNFAGTLHNFTATFDKVTGAASGDNGSGLSYSLQLDVTATREKITGTVTQTATGDVSNVEAAFNPYTLTNKISDQYLKDGDNTKNGVYTVIFPALASQSGLTINEYPQGDGYGTVTVTPAGSVSIAGVLADGTTVTGNAPFWRDYQWPLAVIIKASATASGTTLGGMVQFDTTQADTDASAATITWFKTARAAATHYPNGWPSGIATALIGAKYNAPSGAAALPDLAPADLTGNAILEISDGLLTSTFTRFLNISTTSTVSKIPATDTTYTLTITPTTGLLGGNFLHPAAATPRPVLKGMILQKGANAGGYGFFLSPIPTGSTGEAGGFTLSARPVVP